jgi:hypothetical protein
MYNDLQFWRFRPTETREAEPPVAEVIHIVSILIQHEQTARAIQWVEVKSGKARWNFGTMVSEVLSPRMMGWWSRSSGELASKEEAQVVTDDDTLKRRDDELEANLKSLIANPELAEEAFPDEQIRRKIIPLFQHFRRIGHSTKRPESEKS